MSDLHTLQKSFGELIQRYVDYVRSIFSEPRAFFLRQSEAKGYLEPTVFALISIALPKLFYALLFAPPSLGFSLIMFVPSVIYKLGVLLIVSILLFGLIRLAHGKGDFESVYRSVSYASASSLVFFFPVPILNLFLFAGLFSFLLYFALRETHGLAQRPAVLILLVPLFFILVVGMIRTVILLLFLIKGGFYIYQHGLFG